MTADLERMIQLVAGGGATYRVSELRRAHEFHDLLRDHKPSFYRHLKDAMFSPKRFRAKLDDGGVTVSKRFELGVTVSYEHETVENGIPSSYLGCAFHLCVEGKNMKGNVSLEKIRAEPEAEKEQLWKLVTNEPWPARVEPFIRRGRSLKLDKHLSQLRQLALEEELSLSSELLDEIFLPIDARLFRIFEALRGRGV